MSSPIDHEAGAREGCMACFVEVRPPPPGSRISLAFIAGMIHAGMYPRDAVNRLCVEHRALYGEYLRTRELHAAAAKIR